ncbi:hypothetical protein Syun_015176 [Stephania yunnanensis]|uniref:Cytochrome P450 n=1 Tax=Stephania yunnanensis TaxID=152371 RepID=A0AAP0JKN3_9MAGN
MELLHLFYITLFIVVLTKLLLHPKKQLPPSPPGALPILGHLRLVFTPLHRTLDTLSKQYGQYMFLKLGKRKVLVLSSPSAIEECINKNDMAFANRPRTVAGDYLSYDYTVLALSNYGHHWRTLRRITTTEIFSASSLLASSGVRRDAVRCLLRELYKSTREDAIGDGLLDTEDNKWFFGLLKDTHVPSLFMGPGDYIPIMRYFDVFKIEKILSGISKKRDVFFDEMLEKFRKETSVEKNSKSMLDVFFALQKENPEQYNNVIIKGMIVTMFTAGTDTSALTLEWAMSLLLNHPEVLLKARTELANNIDSNRLLEDSDLANLPYIQSIIQETLRLYPPVPFLVPHESSRECTVGKYDVPSGTILVANAWAIHRDPKVWPEPDKFMPERFMQSTQSESREFKFIPFGIGRRGCPGGGLATRVMALTLASLLQCFEWEKVGDGPVDMSEGNGFTLPKAQSLEAWCKPRPEMLNALSQA